MTFPNYKNKYKSESVVTPKQFLEYRKKHNIAPNFKIPKLVIFCYAPDLIEYILNNYKTKKIEGFMADAYLLEEYNIAVFGKFGIGSPVTTILLEDLIAYGIKNFIALGNTGGISKELKVGDIVICNKAIRDEGVSYHYIPSSKYAYPSENLLNKIRNHLNNNKLNYRIGPSWTHDVMYRETIDEINHYQKEGILTTELESAALFSVASYRNVEIAVIFVVSDILADLKWKPSWHNDKKFKSLKALFNSLIKIDL